MTIIQASADALPFPDQSVDLVFGSPPYCECRTYDDGTLPDGHVVCRDAREWVDWMLTVTAECLRVSRGAVVWVAAGPTRARTYWPACEGLMWRWFDEQWGGGGSSYRPCYWRRVGIPGSGGDQWFRADVEYVMCFKRPGSLPWTDNTSMGHPPKWAPGGEMSHMLSDGTRVNQWEKPGSKTGTTVSGRREKPTTGKPRPSHKTRTKRRPNGQMEAQVYNAPSIANPGTLVDIPVGGGLLGDRMCHANEAPFPEKLAEYFLRSLCPPNGTVLDPFSGSGTTAKVAIAAGRKYVASDIRSSQCQLTKRRTAAVQQRLFS